MEKFGDLDIGILDLFGVWILGFKGIQTNV
jgi:hypothetical protein